MGKTFLLRLLLLICALDVRCEIHAYDLKGTGDLAPLRPVAHRYRAGDDPEDIEYLVADFRGLRAEMRRRTKVIREIADKHPARCPENKVTAELASDPRLGPAPDRDRRRRVPGGVRAPGLRRRDGSHRH